MGLNFEFSLIGMPFCFVGCQCENRAILSLIYGLNVKKWKLSKLSIQFCKYFNDILTLLLTNIVTTEIYEYLFASKYC